MFFPRTYQLHLEKLNKIKTDAKRKDNLNQHMKYLDQLQNNKMQTSFRSYQSKIFHFESSNYLDKMHDIEKNNKKLLDRILSITRRNNEKSVCK
jgi:hypothetical protein